MKTEQEINEKITELEEAVEGIDDEFEEALEDEDVDEDSDQGVEIEAHFDAKKEMLEDQVDLLKWVLGK